jgi:hypothetical protein
MGSMRVLYFVNIQKSDIFGEIGVCARRGGQAAAEASSLQGAYMMLAARSLGLDCGSMSGFNASMNRERAVELMQGKYPMTSQKSGVMLTRGL